MLEQLHLNWGSLVWLTGLTSRINLDSQGGRHHGEEEVHQRRRTKDLGERRQQTGGGLFVKKSRKCPEAETLVGSDQAHLLPVVLQYLWLVRHR